MSELTAQLEQARQEIAEKEAESRAWEERVAGLSQQLKEESSKLEVSINKLRFNLLVSLFLNFIHCCCCCCCCCRCLPNVSTNLIA